MPSLQASIPPKAAPRIAENPTPTLADALEAVIEGRSAPWKNGGTLG